jgi:hypothetical protein
MRDLDIWQRALKNESQKNYQNNDNGCQDGQFVKNLSVKNVQMLFNEKTKIGKISTKAHF